MSATIIDELMISLGIDGSAAKKGMSEVTSSIQGGVSKITGMLGGLTAAFAGVFAVGSAFNDYLNSADAMAKFSRSIGANIEDVHAWSEAVIRSGGSAEGFQGSVKGLTTQLSKMATLGKSKAGNVLAAVGIDPGEVGRQRDAFDVLMDISDKMQEMSAAEATGFGQSLGLDVGTINLLREGRDGVKDLIRHQKELGVYDEATAKAAEDFNDAMADTKQAFTVLVATIGSSVLPALKTFLQYVSQFIAFLRKHEHFVKAFFVMIATAITAYLIPAFINFARALITNPLTWVILALVGLALVIEDLIVWLEGGESALEDFWTELFGSPEEAKQLFEDIKKAVIQFVDESIPKLEEFAKGVQGLVQDIKELWKEISDSTPWKMFQHNMLEVRRDEANRRDELAKMMGDTSFDNFGGAGGGFEANPFADSIRNAINEARESLNGMWDGVKESLSGAWDSIVGALNDGWQAFVDFGQEILNDISKFAEDTFESIRKFFEDAMKACEKAAESFASAANAAISGLNSPINALASNIRTNLIGAIDEAANRWRAFQQEMAIHASIPMPAGGGGGYSSTTNNNSTEVNYSGPITVQANDPSAFTSKTAYPNAAYSNSGIF